MEIRPPWDRKKLGPQAEADRGGGWFMKWRRKDVTQKGEPTGVGRGARNIEGSERGATGRGTKRQKRARDTGLQGPIWTWGAG